MSWRATPSRLTSQGTADGGAVAAGTPTAASGLFVLKTTGEGAIAWQAVVGTTIWGRAVAVAADGGVVAGGLLFEFADTAAVLMKFDSQGQLLWQRAYHGPFASETELFRIGSLPDGGFILAGTYATDTNSFSQLWVARVDSQGHLLWQRIYGNPGGATVEAAIAVRPDGSFAVATSTYRYSLPGWNPWILAFDASGTLQWQHVLDGPDGRTGGLTFATDGSLFLATSTLVASPNFGQLGLTKLDATGALVWSRTLGGAADDHGYGVLATADGGAVVTGMMDFVAYAGRFIPSGDGLAWQATFPRHSTPNTGAGPAYSVNMAADGDLVTAGAAGVGGFAMKFTPEGTIPGCTALGTTNELLLVNSLSLTDIGPTVSLSPVTESALDLTATAGTASVQHVCFAAPPQIVPTLERPLLALLTLLAALSGGFALRRVRSGWPGTHRVPSGEWARSD